MAGIIRVYKNKDNPYVMVNKRYLSDCKLSWKAKGILTYLLSKPDNWKVIVGDLIKQSTDGRDAVYAGLKELKENGYMKKYPIKNDQGKITHWESIVYEEPFTENPEVEKPFTDFPDTAKPDMENPEHNNNDCNKKRYIPRNELEEEEEILAEYTCYINKPNQYVKEQLPKWLDKLTKDEIIFAIRQTAKHCGKSYAYLEKVLCDYHIHKGPL
jgi:hypothetical protein